MKILIDPCYVNPYPFHILPRILRIPGNGYIARSLGKTRHAIGRFPSWALGPGGFDGLDLGLSYTQLFKPDLSVREEVLERYRLARWPILAFHATFDGGIRFFRDTALDLSIDDDRTRRGLRNQIRAAAEIGGRDTILVLHPGRVRSDREDDLETSIRVLEHGLPVAEEKGVILALENMPRNDDGTTHLGADYGELQRVLAALPSPWLKVCMDVGHANSYGSIHARRLGVESPEAYLASFGYCRDMIRDLNTEIVYAHIHYNRAHKGGAGSHVDEHIPLCRIPESERGAFRVVLGELLERTSVSRTGRVNLELVPRRVFGFYTVFPSGSRFPEQMDSVRLLREWLDSGGSLLQGARKPRELPEAFLM